MCVERAGFLYLRDLGPRNSSLLRRVSSVVFEQRKAHWATQAVDDAAQKRHGEDEMSHVTPSVDASPLLSAFAMPDIEMKPAKDEKKDDKKDEKKEKKEEKKEEPPKPPPTPVQEIKYNTVLIDRAVASLEPRFIHRALRTLTALRKRLDETVLRNAIEEVFVKGTRPCIALY